MTSKLFAIAFVLLLSACAPKSELDAAQQRISQLQAENAQLRARLERKPEIPLTMSVRKALTGPGYVAVFNTTTKSPVSAIATLNSKSLGTTKRFELHVNPTVASELGHLEGAVIEEGDTITVENQSHSPLTFTVKGQ